MEKHGLVATTIDIVCTLKFGKKTVTAIIDLKSGAVDREDYQMQLYVSKALWEQEFPNIKIDMLFNYAPNDYRIGSLFSYIHATKKGEKSYFKPYDFKNQTDVKEITKWQWKKYLSLFHGNPSNMAGIGMSVDFSDTYELSLSSDILESIVFENELEDLTAQELF